tara:strand:+ start:194 stop:619 length:426 start_codon:yes stop_codon:yes gene_type:complete
VATPNIGIDDSPITLWDTMAESDVLLLGLASLKGSAKGRLNRRLLSEEEDSTGVLVQTVDNARTFHIKSRCFFDVVLKEPKGNARGTRLGRSIMHKYSGRFIYSYEICVFVQNGQGEPTRRRFMNTIRQSDRYFGTPVYMG